MNGWMQRMRLRFLIGAVKGLEDMRAEYPDEVDRISDLMWEAHQKSLARRYRTSGFNENDPIDPRADWPPYEEDVDGNHIHEQIHVETETDGSLYCGACGAVLPEGWQPPTAEEVARLASEGVEEHTPRPAQPHPLSDLADLVTETRLAAVGDSNDHEIQALQVALETALELVPGWDESLVPED